MEVDEEEEEEEVVKKSKILCSGSGLHLMLWFIKWVSNVSFFLQRKRSPNL